MTRIYKYGPHHLCCLYRHIRVLDDWSFQLSTTGHAPDHTVYVQFSDHKSTLNYLLMQ